MPGSNAANDALDCNDTNNADGVATNPGATEVVGNNIDENCDNDLSCYLDSDRDGFGTQVTPTTDASTYTVLTGVASNGVGSCAVPTQQASATDTDCNDSDGSVNTNATEVVGNDVDENCDSFVHCYVDADGDGYGSAALTYDGNAAGTYTALGASNGGASCSDPVLRASNNANDCADAAGVGTYTASEINPGATEVIGNGVDEDCNDDLHCYVDADSDGYGSAAITYDRNNASTYTTVSASSGSGSCAQPLSFAASEAGDCLDVLTWDGVAAASINPGQAEVNGNGADEDCSGTFVCFVDTDGDSYGITIDSGNSATYVEGTPGSDANCAVLTNGASQDGDCDDTANTIYPGASETAGGGIDNNCDTTVVCYQDVDGDGYGVDTQMNETVVAGGGSANFCSSIGHSAFNTDCNDTNSATGRAINPGSSEETTTLANGVADGVDYDCDGFASCFADVDADGFGSTTPTSPLSASAPGGTVSCDDSANNRANDNQDCNDANTTRGQNTFPGSGYEATVMATGTADGVDYDCDGDAPCFSDVDGDGYGAAEVNVTEASPGTALELGETAACDQLTGKVFAGLDCNDQDNSRGQVTYPGSTQESVALTAGQADGIDYNCDGSAPCFADTDGDSYGDPAATVPVATTSLGAQISCNEQSLGRADDDDDCDDTNTTFFPGAQETTGTGDDNNCDAVITCYQDYDGDGFGSAGPDGTHVVTSDSISLGSPLTPGVAGFDCDSIDLLSSSGDDCMDCESYDNAGGCASVGFAGSVSPGATFVEVLGNLYDEDCDQRIACYPDRDNDSYGDEATDPADNSTWSFTVANSSTEPYNNGIGTCNDFRSSNNQDCHDTGTNSELANPLGVEDPGNGYDDDCDGLAQCYFDADGDGFGGSATDVTNWGGTSQSTPGETGSFERTLGGTYACSPARNEASKQYEGAALVFDCNDTNAQVYPGNPNESTGTSIDNNCDGIINCFVDADGDGWGGSASEFDLATEGGVSAGYDLSQGGTFCTETNFFAEQAGDCHDNFQFAYPNNTSGEVFGHTANEGDQVDIPGVGLREVGTGAGQYDMCGDGSNTCYGVAFDDDCEGTFGCYLDEDGDGWGTAETTDAVVAGADPATYTETCIQPTGTASSRRAAVGSADPNDPAYDCHPDVAAANPGVASDGEIVGNAYDDNCDGVVDCYTDMDGDGYGTNVVATIEFTGDPATANSGASLVEYDTVTQTFDCDLGTNMASRGGAVDSADYDCHDNFQYANPGADEVVGHTPSEGENYVLPNGTTVQVGTDTSAGQVDLCGDGSSDCYDVAFDDDCDGFSHCYVDADGDGMGGSVDTSWAGILPGQTLPHDDVNNTSGRAVDAYDEFTCVTTSNSAIDTDRRSKWGGNVGEEFHDCHDQHSGVYPTKPDGTSTPEIAGHTENPSIPTDDSSAFNENCDQFVECFEDQDQDGFGTDVVQITVADNEIQSLTTNNLEKYNCEQSPALVRTQYSAVGSPDPADPNHDCHPDVAAANPGAGSEIVANAYDDNCDGVVDCYTDMDGDGYGTNVVATIEFTGDPATANSGASLVEYDTVTQTFDCDLGTNMASRGGAVDSADYDCHDNFQYANPGADEVVGHTPSEGENYVLPNGTTVQVGTDTSAGQVDLCGDGSSDCYDVAFDDDCDGFSHCYVDADGDGMGGSVDTSWAGILPGQTLPHDDVNNTSGRAVDAYDEFTCVTTSSSAIDTNRRSKWGGNVGEEFHDCHDQHSGVYPTKPDGTSTPEIAGHTENPSNSAESFAYDENCDQFVECFEDQDRDGFGTQVMLIAVADNELLAETTVDEHLQYNCELSPSGVRTQYTTRGGTRDSSYYNADDYDCHDNNANANPDVAVEVAGTTEEPLNGGFAAFDEDCDGVFACFRDRDNDGYGTESADLQRTWYVDQLGRTPVANGSTVDDGVYSCELEVADLAWSTGVEQTPMTGRGGAGSTDFDCHDNNYSANPGNAGTDPDGNSTALIPTDATALMFTTVTTNAYDDDCNGEVTCYRNVDGDQYGTFILTFEADNGDLVDDAGELPLVTGETYYACDDAVRQLAGVGGLGTDDFDCHDDNAAVFPTTATSTYGDQGLTEVSGNAYDDDCDGSLNCYEDLDNDGYGTDLLSFTYSAFAEYPSPDYVGDEGYTASEVGLTLYFCGPEAATNAGVTVDTALREQLGFDTDRITDVGGASNPDQYDCHDDWEYAHPGIAAEIPGDPFDNDCDGTVSCYVDRDGDGFGAKDSAPVATPSAYDYDAFPFTTAFGEFSAYPVAFVTGLEDYQSAAMEVERAARQDAITGSWYDCRVAGDSGDAGFAAVGGETTDYYDCHDDVASVYPALIAADERPEASGPDDATCDGPIFCQTYNTDGDIVLSDISVGECTGGTWRCFADSGQTFDNGETAGDAYDNDCDGFVFCFDNQDGDQVGTIAVLDGGDDQVATSYDEGVYSCTGTNEARYTGDCHDEPGVQGPTIYPDTTGAVAGDDLGAAARAAFADASYPEATDYRDENCDVVMCYDFATASVLGEGQDSVCSSDDNRKLICITGEVAGDSYDQDCDGAVPCLYDFDGDGFGGGVDVDGTLMPIYTQDNGVRTATTGAVSQDGGLYSCAEPDANEATDNALGLDCNDAAGGENENPGGTEGDLSSYNADAALFELALAAMGDTIDQDCDGQLSCFADADGDGYGAGFAFDDATGPTALADFAVNVVEVTLDKSVYADCDRPVVGDDEPAATSSVRGDCHDDAAEAFPGADSVPGNDLDNNCDRVFTCFQDLDGDGYGSAVEINDDGVSWADVATWSNGRPDACLDEGEADDSQDCLDDIALIQVLDDDLTDGVAEPETVTINTVDWNRARMTNVDASYNGVYFGEIYGDGIDGDCDGVELCFVDADGDGFVGGDAGSVANDSLGRFGTLVEVSDTDGDGIVNCDEPVATVTTALWPYGINVDLSTVEDPFATFFDCDDNDDTINPDAVEVWYNGVDENCDNKSDYDRDGDGYDSREYTEERAACPEAYINASFLDRARLDVNAALAVGAYNPVIGCGRGSDCNDTPNEGEEIYPTFNAAFASQENLDADYMARSADAVLPAPSTAYGLTLDEDVDADIGTTLTLGVKGDPEACEGGGDSAQVDNDCDGNVNTSRDCWFEVDTWAADLEAYKNAQTDNQLAYGFLSKEHYTACAQDYGSGLYFVDRSDPLDFSTLNKDAEVCDRLPTLSVGAAAWSGENDDDVFDFCWEPSWTSPNNSQGRYYRDGDGDLEGDDSQQAVFLCAPGLEQTGLWISNRDDCDDSASETNARGVELCDNTDNNCNDVIDEPTLDLTKALDPACEYHYVDADADSWGLVVADATAPVAETDVYCICPSHELWDTTDNGVLEEQPEPETCPHYLVSAEEVEEGTLATDLVQYGHVIGGTCYVKNSKDCNDLDQLVKPFAPGDERYEQIDGVDNDCNFRMPLIELDCDDDNAFPLLPTMSEALLANPSEVPIASAADVGLETCDPNVSPPSVLCWGEQLPLACDSGTGFWTVSTVALTSYGVFEGASRIPRKVDYNCSSWDCDDQCANRCEGADEVCDGIDNDCNDWLEEFNQADLDGVPDPMASGEIMLGRVNEDELDLDQDNHIACNGVVSSNQNATTTRSCRSYSNFDDCNDLCMPSSPASEAEVCNGFVQPDACVAGEPADVDRDGYGDCGTFGVGDVVDEDLYVMVLAKGDVDAYVEDPETDDPPQIVPLIPPRVYTGQAWETKDNWGTVRECDIPLHTALEGLTGELPALVNDAVGMSEEGIQAWYGETRDAMLDVCVQADTCRVLQAELEASSGAAQDNDHDGDRIDPTDLFPAPPLTGDSELPSYCEDLLDVTCSVVKLRLDALGDEAMYSDASWDPDGCVYPEDDDPDVVNRAGGLYHPEQAITRSVWSQEQIVEARKLVVDFECYRLFGTYGCATEVYSSETTRGTWNSQYELAGSGTSGFFDLPELPSRLLESDPRWWLYLNRYQPSSFTGGTLAGCWGDPRPIDTDRPVDSLENIGLTGGDCAENNVLANRGLTEGPEDLLALYLGTPTSCDTCLDQIDNNCNGLIDAAEPACARCFVSQGYGCAGCSGTATSSTFGTTPTWVPLMLGMLLMGIRRREQP